MSGNWEYGNKGLTNIVPYMCHIVSIVRPVYVGRNPKAATRSVDTGTHTPRFSIFINEQQSTLIFTDIIMESGWTASNSDILSTVYSLS